jgi:hypothetical protein
MMLKRKFSVRLFDLILAGIATDAQQLIVIFFAVQAMPLCLHFVDEGKPLSVASIRSRGFPDDLLMTTKAG